MLKHLVWYEHLSFFSSPWLNCRGVRPAAPIIHASVLVRVENKAHLELVRLIDSHTSADEIGDVDIFRLQSRSINSENLSFWLKLETTWSLWQVLQSKLLGMMELKDCLLIGNQLKAWNGLQRPRTIPEVPSGAVYTSRLFQKLT